MKISLSDSLLLQNSIQNDQPAQMIIRFQKTPLISALPKLKDMKGLIRLILDLRKENKVINRRSKNNLKFNQFQLSSSTNQTLRIRKRRSFKKLLKASPKADEKSFRLNDKELEHSFEDEPILELKPTVNENESTETLDDEIVPIITKENNVIQAQDPESTKLKAKK